MANRPIHVVESGGDSTGLKEFADGADSGVQLPSGTTAQRDSSASAGEIRFNTDTKKIEFYDGIKNLKTLSCYSNEGNKWRQSNIRFENDLTLIVNIDEKFVGERGRINCSLRDPSGYWRWLGLQFVLSDK